MLPRHLFSYTPVCRSLALVISQQVFYFTILIHCISLFYRGCVYCLFLQIEPWIQILLSAECSLSFSGSQADLNCNIQDDTGSFYGVTSQYESSENMTITCSTKVCSFGKQVVEKVEVWTQVFPSCESEQVTVMHLCIALHSYYFNYFVFFPQTEYARFENGRFVYRISRSPMCEYMINFIHKLKHLPEKYMMNSVLENFTILLVITSLTWVGEIPLQDSHSSSCLCCQAVLVAPVGLVKKKKGGRVDWALRWVPLAGTATLLSFHRGWNAVWGASLSAGEKGG